MTPLERAARAMQEEPFNASPEECVHAVLAAIEVPSEAMIEAGIDATSSGDDDPEQMIALREYIIRAWRAMHKALMEKGK